jgi:hypothetical protein
MAILVIILLVIVVIVGRELYIYEKAYCEEFERKLRDAIKRENERRKAGKRHSGEVIKLLKDFYGQG